MINFSSLISKRSGGTLLTFVSLVFSHLAYSASQPEIKLPAYTVPETHSIAGNSVNVKGQKIYYLEEGKGDPVIFIHGNPTSSYLWRNVIPEVSVSWRAIAPDLIGMGRSSKPDIDYSYADHYVYLEGFIKKLQLKNITFVLHDWGAALGFDYARRNPDNVRAIAFMEGVLPPSFPQPSFEAMGEELGGMFRSFKTPGKGEEIVIQQNMFIEQMLPGFVNRSLGAEAMAEYRRPYLNINDRRPLLAWPRAIPIAGEPEDVVKVMDEIKGFMTTTTMPILLVYADPGVVTTKPVVHWYEANIPNLSTAFIGQGLHFLQEDNPVHIGRAVSGWLRRIHREGAGK